MKIEKIHYDYIKEEINSILKASPYLINRYENGNFAKSDKTNDLNARFRWDLYWYCYKNIFNNTFKDSISYLKNTHIDTALRNIVPNIQRKY
jgi:hypothetical protein